MHLSQVGWTTVKGLTDELINKLQSVLLSAASLVLRKRKFDSSSINDHLPFDSVAFDKYRVIITMKKIMHYAWMLQQPCMYQHVWMYQNVCKYRYARMHQYIGISQYVFMYVCMSMYASVCLSQYVCMYVQGRPSPQSQWIIFPLFQISPRLKV